MTKRNLKIAITPEQPLDEVVRELERIGYFPFQPFFDVSFILTQRDGLYCGCDGIYKDLGYVLTTLDELKEME
ncbi:MAG: hypothetical protein ABS863_00320 [Aerococcus urinaeequi]